MYAFLITVCIIGATVGFGIAWWLGASISGLLLSVPVGTIAAIMVLILTSGNRNT